VSGTAEQNGQFPEDHLPGTGLLFDEADGEEGTAALPAAPAGSQETNTAAEFPALGGGGAAPAGVNAFTGEITGGTSAAVPNTGPEVSAVEEAEETPEPAFRTVYDFYEGIYGPLYEHHDSSPGVLAQRGTAPIRWCKQWWNHGSVMMRLTALWQAYEAAYAEGGGAVSTWMLDHADRHFDRIMAEGGPLSECRSDHGNNMTRYPVDPLPDGLNLDATTVQPETSGTERSPE